MKVSIFNVIIRPYAKQGMDWPAAHAFAAGAA
jgi:hypothetical protein